MKILLVSPPITLHKLDLSQPLKPILIGLGYIASALRNKGHEVKILSCIPDSSYHSVVNLNFTRYGLSDVQISEEIKSFAPDIVGISSMFTPYFKDGHNIARIVKEYKKNVLVVFGGVHASTFYNSTMKDTNVDLLVVGEGENTICEVAERFKNKDNFIGVKGLVHRINGELKIEEPRDAIRNLDEIAFPAWDLLERDLAVNKIENIKNKFLIRKPVGHIFTSRGCPRECYFCSVKLIWGRSWRNRSAKNVVDEIELLKQKYGYNEFHFVDDNCSVSSQRMLEICDEILSRKLQIKLAAPTGIALSGLNKEVLTKMKKAGFYRLCFGVESGDPEGQKIIKKRIDLQKARDVIACANKLGYWTSATFILGFPHETPEKVKATVDFAKTSNIDFAIFYLLVPQPATEAYQILKDQGLIDLDSYIDPSSEEWFRISIVYSDGFKTKFFSNSQLRELLNKAYRDFFIYKIFSFQTYINLVRKVRNFEDLKYMLGLATIPFMMLVKFIFGNKLSNTAIRGKFRELKDMEEKI